MTRPDPAQLHDRLTQGLNAEPQEPPPHPTDDSPEVKALARGLNGLAFGDPAQPLNFRTITEYYQPLAQSILNWQAGWVIDPKTKTWTRIADATRT